MSRQNKIPSSRKPGEYVLALIPLWDMANHTTGHVKRHHLLLLFISIY